MILKELLTVPSEGWDREEAFPSLSRVHSHQGTICHMCSGLRALAERGIDRATQRGFQAVNLNKTPFFVKYPASDVLF